jgi:hypothetical protein
LKSKCGYCFIKLLTKSSGKSAEYVWNFSFASAK